MKKSFGILFTVICLCLVLTCISACPSFAASNPVLPGDTQTPQELIMWTDQDGLDEFEQKYVDIYNQTHTNVQIRVVSRPRDVDTDTIASLMSGTSPDILILSDSEVGAYANLGLILPMDEYLESWNELDGMNMDILERYKINGSFYGIPCGEYTMGLLYHKSRFQSAGITPPKSWTWKEFQKTASRLTDKETKEYGFALNWRQWSAWTFQMFAWAGGDDLSEAERNEKLKTTFTAPGVIEAARFYRSLKQNGAIQFDMNKKWDALKKDFAKGTAAMIYVGLDDLESLAEYGMDMSDIGFLPIPTGPSGTNQTQLGGSCYVMNIGVRESKRQAVFDYYALLSSRSSLTDKETYHRSKNTAYIGGELRTDVEYTYPKEFSSKMLETMETYQENGRYSFYGYATLSPFIQDAIIKIMTDDTVDIEETFAYYENEANKQAVKLYNNSLP